MEASSRGQLGDPRASRVGALGALCLPGFARAPPALQTHGPSLPRRLPASLHLYHALPQLRWAPWAHKPNLEHTCWLYGGSIASGEDKRVGDGDRKLQTAFHQLRDGKEGDAGSGTSW